jgi:hypothetical protein
VATLLGSLSASEIDPEKITDLGFIGSVPPQLWLGYAMISVGFALCLRGRLANGILAPLHLVTLVFFLHGIPAVAYGTLRYAWAWKHIGLVDYLLRHGTLEGNVPGISAYQNWPSLFVITAGISRLAHLGTLDLIQIARFFPLVLNIAYVLTLPFIWLRFTRDWRLIWTADWIFATGNWVGQDYFSPQGVAFFLYMVLIAVCLGPLQDATGTPVRLRSAKGQYGRGLLGLLTGAMTKRTTVTSKMSSVLSAVVALLVIILIVSMHQLTPIIMVTALGVLTIGTDLNIGYFIFSLVASVSWMLFVASPFMAVQLPNIISEIGHAQNAILNRFINSEHVSSGQAVVVIGDRVFTAGIGCLAAIGFVRRRRQAYHDGLVVVLALVGLPAAAITSYGGEVVFRVYLFALPFLAFLAGAFFFPSAARGQSMVVQVLTTGLSVLLIMGFILSNNGKDRQYRFSAGEVEAATWVFGHAPAPCLLIEGGRNYPSQFLNYENFTYVPLDSEPPEVRDAIAKDPAVYLEDWFRNGSYKSVLLVITRSQIAYEEDLGLFPRGFLTSIEQSLLVSAKFKVVFAAPGALVFSLNDAN